jgi:hypothetical protein
VSRTPPGAYWIEPDPSPKARLALRAELEVHIRREHRKDPCWLWEGPTAGGYRRVYAAGRNWSAHRAMWRLERGQIPGFLRLRRRPSCPKLCVRPAHWQLRAAGPDPHSRRSTRGR